MKNVIIIISALWYSEDRTQLHGRHKAKRGGMAIVVYQQHLRTCMLQKQNRVHHPAHLQPHSGPVKSEKTKGKKIKKLQEDEQDNTATEHNQPEGIEHSIRRRDYGEKMSSSQIGDVGPNKRPSI